MSYPSYAPPPGFIPVRDPHTLKIVCYYNVVTQQVEVVLRGDVRRGTLPDVAAQKERKGVL